MLDFLLNFAYKVAVGVDHAEVEMDSFDSVFCSAKESRYFLPFLEIVFAECRVFRVYRDFDSHNLDFLPVDCDAFGFGHDVKREIGENPKFASHFSADVHLSRSFRFGYAFGLKKRNFGLAKDVLGRDCGTLVWQNVREVFIEPLRGVRLNVVCKTPKGISEPLGEIPVRPPERCAVLGRFFDFNAKFPCCVIRKSHDPCSFRFVGATIAYPPAPCQAKKSIAFLFCYPIATLALDFRDLFATLPNI
jgi:hypothetical protein